MWGGFINSLLVKIDLH
jgi:hypothetical protein